MDLNIYAKLGGTAWGIEKKDTTKRELIIGIGSTVNYNNQQIISIANVFDNSGVYLAGACNPIVEIDNYPEELEKLILLNRIENFAKLIIFLRENDKSDLLNYVRFKNAYYIESLLKGVWLANRKSEILTEESELFL